MANRRVENGDDNDDKASDMMIWPSEGKSSYTGRIFKSLFEAFLPNPNRPVHSGMAETEAGEITARKASWEDDAEANFRRRQKLSRPDCA